MVDFIKATTGPIHGFHAAGAFLNVLTSGLFGKAFYELAVKSDEKGNRIRDKLFITLSLHLNQHWFRATSYIITINAMCHQTLWKSLKKTEIKQYFPPFF